MESNCGAATVSVVAPEIVPEVAVMEVEPALTVVARPAALMVATEDSEETQVTVEVMFCVVLFE